MKRFHVSRAYLKVTRVHSSGKVRILVCRAGYGELLQTTIAIHCNPLLKPFLGNTFAKLKSNILAPLILKYILNEAAYVYVHAFSPGHSSSTL